MIVSIQKPGPTASGGLMAGSVFSKIAERVYAKDLRLPLTSAIDTNTVVIPHVKAGEMRQTQRVLEELNINIQGKIADSGKEVWEVHTLLRKLLFWKVGESCRILCRA